MPPEDLYDDEHWECAREIHAQGETIVALQARLDRVVGAIEQLAFNLTPGVDPASGNIHRVLRDHGLRYNPATGKVELDGEE